MRNFAFLCILVFIFGCNKPNPTPEIIDEIYLDLKNRAAEAKKDLEIEKKKLEGLKKDLDAAIPQTGAIKFAQKRYFEAESAIEKINQTNKYYEIAAESRKRHFRQRYVAAFSSGKSPISEEEIESYKKSNGIHKGNASWNTKERVKRYENRAKASLSEKSE